MKFQRAAWVFVVLIIISTGKANANGQAKDLSGPHSALSFIDFTSDYDLREFYNWSANTLIRFSDTIQYLSLVNYSNSIDSKNADLTNYYAEQSVYWSFLDAVPLDIAIQWVSRSGANNDFVGLGVRWRLANTNIIGELLKQIHMFYGVNFLFLQTNFEPISGWRWQIEHIFNLPLLPSVLDRRVTLGGFVYQFGHLSSFQALDHKLIAKLQLNLRVTGDLYVAAIARRNEYLPSDQSGLGMGLRYFRNFR